MTKAARRILKDEHGVAILYALFAALVILVLAGLALGAVIGAGSLQGTAQQDARANHAAEAGEQIALADIHDIGSDHVNETKESPLDAKSWSLLNGENGEPKYTFQVRGGCEKEGAPCAKGTERTIEATGEYQNVSRTRKLKIGIVPRVFSYALYSAGVLNGGVLEPTSPPVITGTPTVGSTLTLESTGGWSPKPSVIEHKWWDCDAQGSCAEVGTGATYTINENDVDHTIYVKVTAKLETQERTLSSNSFYIAPTIQDYLVANCPKALGENKGAGSWRVDALPENTVARKECKGWVFEGGTWVESTWVGVAGSSIPYNTNAIDTIEVSPRGGTKISKAKIWWYVPAVQSGSSTWANVFIWRCCNAEGKVWSELIKNDATPEAHSTTPAEYTLESGAYAIQLGAYCSYELGPVNCEIGPGGTGFLEMLGSELKVEGGESPVIKSVTGRLVEGGTLSGTESVTVKASDNGPGVYSVVFRVDSIKVANQVMNSNGGYCKNTKLGKGDLSFWVTEPCPLEAETELGLNTTGLSDGTHTLEVCVASASEKTTCSSPYTITTRNYTKASEGGLIPPGTALDVTGGAHLLAPPYEPKMTMPAPVGGSIGADGNVQVATATESDVNYRDTTGSNPDEKLYDQLFSPTGAGNTEPAGTKPYGGAMWGDFDMLEGSEVNKHPTSEATLSSNDIHASSTTPGILYTHAAMPVYEKLVKEWAKASGGHSITTETLEKYAAESSETKPKQLKGFYDVEACGGSGPAPTICSGGTECALTLTNAYLEIVEGTLVVNGCTLEYEGGSLKIDSGSEEIANLGGEWHRKPALIVLGPPSKTTTPPALRFANSPTGKAPSVSVGGDVLVAGELTWTAGTAKNANLPEPEADMTVNGAVVAGEGILLEHGVFNIKWSPLAEYVEFPDSTNGEMGTYTYRQMFPSITVAPTVRITAGPGMAEGAEGGNETDEQGGTVMFATTGEPAEITYQLDSGIEEKCETSWEACEEKGYAVKTGLTVNTTHKVTIRIKNGNGEASASYEWTLSEPHAPVNTVLPVIEGTVSGRPIVGRTLTVTNGTWTFKPTSYEYAWEDCNSSGTECSVTAGATASSYTPVAADSKHTIRAVVTAKNLTGSTKATSNATGTVLAGPPQNTVIPAITETKTGGWPSVTTIDGTNALTGVSCPSSGFCVAVDSSGNVLTTTNSGSTWTTTAITGAPVFTAVSCSPGTTSISGLCMAVTNGQTAYLATNPTGGATAWVSSTTYTAASHLAVSCATTSFCLSTTSGQTNIAAVSGTTATWTDSSANGVSFNADSCTSTTFCLHVDSGSGIDYSGKPTEAAGWGTFVSTGFVGNGVSCAPGTTSTSGLCVDVGPSGTIATATSPSGTWTKATIDGSNTLEAVSCASTTFCVAVDSQGNALVSTKPTEASSWSLENPAVLTSLAAVSCYSSTFCVAVDNAGHDTVYKGTSVTTMKTSTGTWANEPTSYAYKWLRCNSKAAECSAISGATASSYTETSSDTGHTLRSEVTATNIAGSASATSNPTGTVGAPVNTSLPTLSDSGSGTVSKPQTGDILEAAKGSWTNAPTSYKYQWQRCSSAGTECANASSYPGFPELYEATSADVGHTIRVEVTATNAAGSGTAASAATGTVAYAAPSDTSLPTISGTAELGQSLTASTGTWTNEPTSYGYQWERCNTSGTECSAISGATASTYTVTEADVAHTLRVEVTATNGTGSGKATSSATAKVAAGRPSNTALPAITGTAAVGQKLTTSTGTWTNEPTSYSYQWERCEASGEECQSIEGATSATYTIAVADVEHTLRVEVTATNAAGSGKATSNQTGAVVGAPENTGIPAITETHPTKWAPPAVIDSTYSILGLSCPSTALCVAVDTNKDILTSTNSGATWTVTAASTVFGNTPSDVSCPTTAFCIAFDNSANLASSTNPTGGTTAWTYSTTPLPGGASKVACVSSSLCVMGQSTGYIGWSATPATGSSWLNTRPTESAIKGISCPTTTFCAAVDSTGNLITAAKPTEAASWTKINIDGTTSLNSVSCTSASFCAAVDSTGNLLTATKPTEAGGWTKTDIDGTTVLNDISCGTTAYCAAVDTSGRGLASTNPTGGASAWTTQSVDTHALQSVACYSTKFCAAVDNNGQATLYGEQTELSSSTGTWTHEPTSYKYQWQRCSSTGTECSAISGATSSLYLTSASDSGHTIRVEVTATNSAGSGKATSEQTSLIGTPYNKTAPTISDLSRSITEPQEGDYVYQSNVGTWGKEPTSYTRQWVRCNSTGGECVNITGATGESYKPVAEDVGHTLRLEVTATNSVGSETAESTASGVVKISVPKNTSAPTVTGTAEVGQTLTANHGEWTHEPTYTYQWERCNSAGAECVNITGATGETYKPVAEDVSHTIKVAVTATDSTGSATATSTQTAKIAAGPPANTVLPTIEGPGNWVSTSLSGTPAMYAVSCSPGTTGTSGLCLGLGSSDRVYLSTSPTSSWVEGAKDYGSAPAGASCPNTAFCVATEGGQTSIGTVSGTSVSWADNSANASSFAGVSCTSETFCAHIDSTAGVVYTTTPHTIASWTATSGVTLTGEAGKGLSCAPGTTSTTGLCVDVGTLGRIATATNPSGTWTTAEVDGANTITAVSCASTAFCAAVDNAGYLLTSTKPTESASWVKTDIDGSYTLNAVSCPTTTFCAAVDSQGQVLTSSNPTGGTGTWSTESVDPITSLTGISCTSSSFCAAVDNAGHAVIYSGSATTALTATAGTWTNEPTSYSYQWKDCNTAGESCTNITGATGTSYTETSTDAGHTIRVEVTATNAAGSGKATSVTSPPVPATQTLNSENSLRGVSCPSASLCATVDGAGHIFTTTNPGVSATWATTTIGTLVSLSAISCIPGTTGTTGLCTAISTADRGYLATKPTGGASSWIESAAFAGAQPPGAVSCATTTLCVATAGGQTNIGTVSGTSVSWADNSANASNFAGVSCTSETFCAHIDSTAGVVYTTTPHTIASWTATSGVTLTGEAGKGLSCAPGTTSTTGLCVDVGTLGRIATATNPSGTWTTSTVDETNTLEAVSCASTSFCAAVDAVGHVLVSTKPTEAASWSTEYGTGTYLSAVSCYSSSLCVAVDTTGKEWTFL